jgi:hypothetical protein
MRDAWFSSSMSIFMNKRVFHKGRLKAMSDNVFNATPILDWMNKRVDTRAQE